MLKLFCALTGEDYKLASAETPASRKKISTLGSVMLIPVMMWFLIGGCIAHNFLEAGLVPSLFSGLVAGFIILILERAIIMTGNNKGITSFRLIIGFIIASLGAIFIDEFFFEKDIKQEQFKELSTFIDVEKGKINSKHGVLIETKNATIESLRASWMVAAEEARKEADGTGGSGRKGISKITSLKLEQADALKKELDKTELEVTSLRDVRENELAKAQTSIEVNLHGQSILARIKSLFKLIRKDLAALVTYIFFTVLLFSLEFIVIIMKHSLPPTSYDRRVAAMEQVSNRRLERLLAAGVQSLDPVENSLQERKMEMELSRALPTLFSERAGKNYHETNKSAA